MALSAAVASAVALLGCAGAKGAPPSSPPAGRTLQVVVGENVWGSLVAQLAGKAATVTSIVTDPNADPHNYESSSDTARAFADASYVILNGAGYDGWAQQLISGNPSSKRRELTVADLLGKKDGDNPHFWYNPAYVTAVADRIESDLKSLDPADSAYFDAQRSAFDAAMAPSRNRLTAIKATFTGTPVAATESIFVYLGNALGLRIISSPEFMNAVAEGNDPPAPAVIDFQKEITSKQAKVLVYNLQTSTEVTTAIRKLAVRAGIPTVGVTETIQPPDAPFEQWFEAELEQLQHALTAGAG